MYTFKSNYVQVFYTQPRLQKTLIINCNADKFNDDYYHNIFWIIKQVVI